MADYTLSFLDKSEANTGWTSFHSYVPDFMVNMNNEFYTFKDGQLYIHNVEQGVRNNFYGVQYPTELEFLSNEGADIVKSFKTIEMEGSPKTWDVTVTTDTDAGHIDKSSFETKEGFNYAYIRRNSTDVVKPELLSVQGIGNLSSYASNVFTFSNVPSNISIGDKLYSLVNGSYTVVGEILNKSITTITTLSTAIVPTNGTFMFVSKNPVAESYGLKGYYASVRITNNDTTPVEVFAVSSEVSKSFP